MSALDVIWHLLGFATVPVLFALFAATSVKLMWRQPLRQTPWWRLVGTAAAACLVVALVGLMWTGRDGAMLTYAVMVLACGITLWWPLRARR